MKKYRVTEKHEYLKEGLILSNYIDSNRYYSPQSNYGVTSCSNYEIDMFKKDDWIKEIQEPEFTKDEVIHILNKYNTDFVSACGKCDFEELIKEWEYLKQKHENK